MEIVPFNPLLMCIRKPSAGQKIMLKKVFLQVQPLTQVTEVQSHTSLAGCPLIQAFARCHWLPHPQILPVAIQSREVVPTLGQGVEA